MSPGICKAHNVFSCYICSDPVVLSLEAERDRLKNEKEALCYQIETEYPMFQKEIDRLKEWLAEEKDTSLDRAQEIDHLTAANTAWAKDFEEMTKDRDAWKAKAEKLAETLKKCLKWIEPVVAGLGIPKDAEMREGVIKPAKAALEEMGND